jgi:hypothetical protein
METRSLERIEFMSARSVTVVAREYRVGWPLMPRHFIAHADALPAAPQPPVTLGIDETRRGRAKGPRTRCRTGGVAVLDTQQHDLRRAGRGASRT